MNHLNYILHVHSTVFIVSFDNTEKVLDCLHGVKWEDNAALTDHFAASSALL